MNSKAFFVKRKTGWSVSGLSYVIAKTVLVIPIFFLFAIFGLGIPSFAIQDVPVEGFGWLITLFAALLFVFESVAECLSVWFDDPILGILQLMNFWFVVFPVISTDNNSLRDLGVMLAIGCFYKCLYAFGVIYKTTKVVSMKKGRRPVLKERRHCGIR